MREAKLEEVQAMTAAHHRLRSVVNELTEVNLELWAGNQRRHLYGFHAADLVEKAATARGPGEVTWR